MNQPGPEDARSTAEREGIVDQQDAALAAMEAADDSESDRDEADRDPDADRTNEAVNPSRPPAEGGRDEVDAP